MTVQKLQSIGKINRNFTEAPARIVSKQVGFHQVVIVLNGDKKDERVLAHALCTARDYNAELVVIHTHQAVAREQAELYLKTVKNKLKAQYDMVIAYLYSGTSASAAIESLVDNKKNNCVVVADEKRNWLQRLWQGDQLAEFTNRHNLRVHQVDV